MNKTITHKKISICLLLCLIIMVFTDLVLPMNELKVYDSVIRLHILANSDATIDQDVKLAVRDEILKANVFGNASTKSEAESNIELAAKQAVETANSYLESKGLPYKASYQWGYESYPTREYKDTRLPAGRYLSLRIVLGEGEGANWWCVLFPPLCTGVATKKVVGDKSDVVFDNRNNKYKIKFKILEWLCG